MEDIIIQNSKIKDLKSPDSFKDLEAILKLSQQSFDANSEVTKLVKQMNDLKQQHEAEIETNSAMFEGLQLKLIAREEDINKLKRILSRFEVLGLTADGFSSPPDSNEEFENSSDLDAVKDQLRKLSGTLKTVTEQRNIALEKLSAVEQHNFDSQEVSTSEVASLEAEAKEIRLQASTTANAVMLLKAQIASKTKENNDLSKSLKAAEVQKVSDQEVVDSLKKQLSTVVEEMAELTEENCTLRRSLEMLEELQQKNHDKYQDFDFAQPAATALDLPEKSDLSEIKELKSGLLDLKNSKETMEHTLNEKISRESQARDHLQTKLDRLRELWQNSNENLSKQNELLKKQVQDTLNQLKSFSVLDSKFEAFEVLSTAKAKADTLVAQLQNALASSMTEQANLHDQIRLQTMTLKSLQLKRADTDLEECDISAFTNELQDKCIILANEKKERELEIHKLLEEISKLKIENGALNGKLERSIDYSKIQTQLADLSQNMNTCYASLDSCRVVKTELQDELDASRTSMCDMKMKIETLEKEKEMLGGQLLSMKLAENAASTNSASLVNDNQLDFIDSRQEINRKSAEVKNLKAQIEKMSRESGELKSSLQNAEKEISELQKELKSTSVVQPMEQQMLDSPNENSKITSTEDAGLTFESLKLSLEETRQKLKEEQQIKSKSIQALRTYKNKVTKLESESIAKDSAISDIRKSLDSCNADLLSAKTQLEQKKVEIFDLTNRLSESTRLGTTLQKLVDDKEGTIAKSEKEILDLSNKIKEIESSKDNLEIEFKRRLIESDQYKEQSTETLKTTIECLKANVLQLSENLRKADNELELKAKEIDELKQETELKLNDGVEIKESISKLEVELFEKSEQLRKMSEYTSSLEIRLVAFENRMKECQVTASVSNEKATKLESENLRLTTISLNLEAELLNLQKSEKKKVDAIVDERVNGIRIEFEVSFIHIDRDEQTEKRITEPK